jgi:hypothetical protein
LGGGRLVGGGHGSLRHEKSRLKAAPKETGDVGSVQTDRMDEQIADDREEERDQRRGDGDAPMIERRSAISAAVMVTPVLASA